MLEDLTSNLISKPNNKAKLMYEVAACISAAVDADDFNLYIHETEGQITLFSPQEEKAEAGPRSQQIRSGTSIAAHCAKVKDIIKTSLGVRDPRFPLGVSGWPPTAKVLCHPVCSEDEDIEAVLEFVKDGKGNSFTEEDIEVGYQELCEGHNGCCVCCQIINSYLVWGGIGIHYANQYSRIHHQKYVNDFLLSVVRYGEEEVVLV